MSPQRIEAGTTLQATVQNFPPGQPLTIVVFGASINAEIVTDAQGNANGSYDVPGAIQLCLALGGNGSIAAGEHVTDVTVRAGGVSVNLGLCTFVMPFCFF